MDLPYLSKSVSHDSTELGSLNGVKGDCGIGSLTRTLLSPPAVAKRPFAPGSK
jgi:hypothetical protein